MSIEFLLTSLIVVTTPGTGVLYTLSCAIGGGFRTGVFATIGCTFGIVPHLLAAMLGLSGVMQISTEVFQIVRWVGVLYLIYVGVSMIRDGDLLTLGGPATGSLSMGSVVRRGILLNLLNPRLTIFFFAFLPQFLDPTAGLIDPELLGLGSTFMVISLIVFVVYAYASATVRDRLIAAPAAQPWLQRVFGTILLGVAARLAVTDR